MELKHQPALLRPDPHPGARCTRFGGAAVPPRQAVHPRCSTGAAGGVGVRCHTASFPGGKAQLCLRGGEEEVFRCSQGAGESQICVGVDFCWVGDSRDVFLPGLSFTWFEFCSANYMSLCPPSLSPPLSSMDSYSVTELTFLVISLKNAPG